MTSKILLGLAAVVLLAVSSTAHAVNPKAYNGNYCRPADLPFADQIPYHVETNSWSYRGDDIVLGEAGGVPGLYYTDTLITGYGLSNRSEAYSIAVCPVIVDEPWVFSGTTSILVHWINRTEDESLQLWCTFHSLDEKGAPIESTSASGLEGWIEIPNITIDAYNGSYLLECIFPPYALLTTIYIQEKD
jgi:hypothetical protein